MADDDVTVEKLEPGTGPSTGTGRKTLTTLGVTGLQYGAGWIDDEWLVDLKGTRGVRTFRQMKDNDGTVGASLRLIKFVVQQVKWHVEAAADGGTDGEEAAQLLQECIDDMEHTWADFLGQVLSMLAFGWSSHEKVYKVRGGLSTTDPTRRSKHDDGKLGWRKFSPRAQETLYAWELDDEGEMLGWWQIAAPRFSRVFLPATKLLHFRVSTDKANPEGESLLRQAYRNWYFATRLEELEAIGIERDLVGLPVFEIPGKLFDSALAADKLKIQQYASAVQRIRRNEQEGLVIPSEELPDGHKSGYKFRLVTSGGQRQLDPGAAIVRKQKAIAQSLLTAFQFLGMDGSGSLALSRDATETFTTAIATICDIVEETFHRSATCELMALNGYKPEAYARLKHGAIEKRDVEAFSKGLSLLVGAGVLTPTQKTEVYVRGELGLPELDEDDEMPTDEEREQAASDARRILEASEQQQTNERAEAGKPAQAGRAGKA